MGVNLYRVLRWNPCADSSEHDSPRPAASRLDDLDRLRSPIAANDRWLDVVTGKRR
ncbi:hypothetical protein ACQP1W_30790 [Spirillospora sp. CA-255316]